MAYCYPCNRSFPTYNGYQNHIDNSAMHAENDWECDICDRSFATEQSRRQHYSSASGHPYCSSCDRIFRNENSLMQHMHSRVHVGSKMRCPFCKQSYPTASAVTIHLESGTCSSGQNRQSINEAIRKLDQNHVITNRMLTMPGYDNVETIPTERSWNGSAYECCLCRRDFGKLSALKQHLNSPFHEQKLYHCPKPTCRREFKLLSGLVAHFESESCALFRFGQVQQQAKNGIQNMVGRMIQN